MCKTLMALALVAVLTGCAGLRVDWVATYSTDRAHADKAK